MIFKKWFLFFFPFFIYASNMIEDLIVQENSIRVIFANVFDKKDIQQETHEKFIQLTFLNTKILKAISKKIDSPFLKEIFIYPFDPKTVRCRIFFSALDQDPLSLFEFDYLEKMVNINFKNKISLPKDSPEIFLQETQPIFEPQKTNLSIPAIPSKSFSFRVWIALAGMLCFGGIVFRKKIFDSHFLAKKSFFLESKMEIISKIFLDPRTSLIMLKIKSSEQIFLLSLNSHGAKLLAEIDSIGVPETVKNSEEAYFENILDKKNHLESSVRSQIKEKLSNLKSL